MSAQPQEITRVIDQYIPSEKVVYDHKVVPVPLPSPPAKEVIHKVYVTSHAYDCEKGYSDFKHQWSQTHQRYCCLVLSLELQASMGCKGRISS
ncbi:unnamed protein product [Effrenium voratum]|uniref:Uncharacterized protein n=1 Tax=Effrenium voratum TaxID=2562239 RepID=A0AA36IBG2_9DINO|nr:unnamed protein product [Effrenium voratum]